MESNWRTNADSAIYYPEIPELAARLVDFPDFFVMKLSNFPGSGFVLRENPAVMPVLQLQGVSFILEPGETFPYGFDVFPD